jgi:hypothetical protein
MMADSISRGAVATFLEQHWETPLVEPKKHNGPVKR